MRVLILDNFDSFVYNLADYVGKLGATPIVVRSNRLRPKDLDELSPDRIILSPGPGHPSETRYTGICREAVRRFSREIPVLGVCLGHQLIAHLFGGRIVRARKIIHGKASLVRHDGRGIFRGLANPLRAGRYHSLIVEKDSLPKCLEISAYSLDDYEIMAIRHRNLPVAGVQFHPESILTADGIKIIKNFLEGEV